jgi:hypothetical protein
MSSDNGGKFVNIDGPAVCFGRSETDRTRLRYQFVRFAALPGPYGERARTGSECCSTAEQAYDAQTGKRNEHSKWRQRHGSALVIAVVVLLLPLAAAAGSVPFVWPGKKTIVVIDYTSNTYAPIVKAEVAAWSRIMPGGTTLAYSRRSPKDCNDFGGLQTKNVPVGEIWICSTATVGAKDLWGQGFVYALNDLIVRGYAKVEERGPKTSHERYGLVCHELGHTLGLRHMTGRETCMGANRVKREFPGQKDKATLAKRYAAAGSP